MLDNATLDQPNDAPSDTIAATRWVTPDFTVVDTAMEVTAYSLNTL